MTAWLALSPSTGEAGCMRFVAGSHKNAILPHRDTFADQNLLTRGQEVAVTVNEQGATDIVLAPGQFSLHHGLMFHGSGPKQSQNRRIGVAIRYINPNVRQQVGARDYALLVRGTDRARNFILFSAPRQDFDPAALALHREIMEARAAVSFRDTSQVGHSDETTRRDGPWSS